jgi:DNA-binding NtrC family response regulator
MDTPPRILVVDDEPVARDSLAAWLREDGHPVDTCASGAEAIARCGEAEYAVCFLDLRMPSGLDGLATLVEVRRIRPETAVVIMTAYAAVDTAVEAMKQGAEDYIVKPFNLSEISLLVERLLRRRRIELENVYLRKRLYGQYQFHDLVSKNPKMQEIFELIREVAHLRSTVLIQGESGVGKELVARALHYSGDRADHPFVPVSCTALPETLLESELFGHEKGAFTGAVTRRPGKFELAAGGTIFLDEIGEISVKLQMDLLRVLEERRFFRVGGIEEIEVDVRFIAATNRDLQDAVRRGAFRDDLYYRLNVIHVPIPPLRERLEDVPLLVEQFIRQLSIEMGKEKVTGISEEALRLLMSRDWPGNVRELRNAVERAMVTCRTETLAEDDFGFLVPVSGEGREWLVPADLSLAEVERRVIEAVLARAGGNVRDAAVKLGIDRSTLYEKLKRYGTPR